MTLERALRVLAAALIVAGGFVHLDLWNDGYRNIESIGDLFLVNVAASVVVALAVLITGRWPVLAGAAAVTLASLAALVISRSVGLLGFMEGWTDEAVQVLAAEIGAIAALAAVASVRYLGRRAGAAVAVSPS